jgi:PTH1 family peptidyl-tRNA hydrolase
MNASGRAVGSLTRRFGLAPGRLVVVLDDVELPLGRVRIRKGGRDGGHRGLRSIIATVGSEDIPRIRVGVGACPPGQSLADFVLSAFDDDDRDAVHGLVVRAADAVECLLADGADQAMNRFN